MKIKDFIDEAGMEIPEIEDEKFSLEDVEKTAEYLEALSTEDSILDDMAKLAVLQDVAGEHTEEVEKIAVRIFNLGERTVGQVARHKKTLAVTAKDVAETNLETARLYKDVKSIKKQTENLKAVDGSSSGRNLIFPLAIGGGAGALGTGMYYKDKEKKMIEEFRHYVEAQNSKSTKK